MILGHCRTMPEDKEIFLLRNMKRKRKRAQVNLERHLPSKFL